ncbi:MAG: DUF2924 domain-containing protein [Holosporaceae bacterium]|jgi:hypothetical protein|nr:DUF2924 domain-containing protein [Holosporaceae bacterium]
MTDDFKVLKQILELETKSINELTKLWESFYDHKPMSHSKTYMVSKIAYKIQELAYGGLSVETRKRLDDQSLSINGKIVKKKYKPLIGSKIVKEYHDKTYEILVVEGGFSFKGEVFKSLSAIANKITGTKWNGLKFFGIKQA